MKPTHYMTAQNPNDKLWYVVGSCGQYKGKTQYMPVSTGYTTKALADHDMSFRPTIEASEKSLVSNWDGKRIDQ